MFGANDQDYLACDWLRSGAGILRGAPRASSSAKEADSAIALR